MTPDVILIEPDINPITRRFGLPVIANYPPLAQVRLAGQIDGGGVEIRDLRVAGERKRLLERVRGDAPAIVGVSLTFTSNAEEAIRVAGEIRRAAPGALIVLGGSAASEEPGSFTHTEFDLIAFRGGDTAFSGLVRETRRAGVAPDRFPGFYHREGDRWVLEEGNPTPAIGELKPYAWEALPRRYWRTYYQGMRIVGMGQTSEGCPYDCNFCSVWITHGRRIRIAALDNVKHDLVSLPRMARGFFFADDIWMQGSQKQIEELYDPLFEWVVSDYLPRRGGDFWFTAETRTDLFLREEERFKEWIRNGNLTRIFFGLEAPTDEQLDRFSKRNTVEHNSLGVRRASELGAMVNAQFVVPCDADRAYFDEMVRFVREHRQWINVSNFTVATPLPGTVLYNEALESLPDLADRGAVRGPGFGLFTALLPTRLDIREFYEQMARLYQEANQIHFKWSVIFQGFRTLYHSPWLLQRLTRMTRVVRTLRSAETFIETHREVQGERLMKRPAAVRLSA